MDRQQKTQAIADLKTIFDEAGTVVVAHNLGLTVANITNLRARLRQVGAVLKIVKNTLAIKGLEGRAGSAGEALFSGPVAIAYAADPVVAAKVMTDYAKEQEKLVLVGGIMGNLALDAKAVAALASLPSLDEIRAKIVGVVVAPATKVAAVLNAPSAQLARVFSAYANKDAA